MEENNINEIMSAYVNMFGNGLNPFRLFQSQSNTIVDTTKKHLGNDIYLVYYTEEDKHPLTFRLENYKNPKSKKIFDNKDYGYLMKDGIKLSDITFRIGGFGGKYKNNYCQLIQYPNNNSSGNNCLVDINGNIVLSESKYGEHLSYKDGIIATMNNYIYNLKTGKKIIRGKIVTDSKDFIFVENKYDFKKEYTEGVYKIDINTGEYKYYPSI